MLRPPQFLFDINFNMIIGKISFFSLFKCSRITKLSNTYIFIMLTVYFFLPLSLPPHIKKCSYIVYVVP